MVYSFLPQPSGEPKPQLQGLHGRTRQGAEDHTSECSQDDPHETGDYDLASHPNGGGRPGHTLEPRNSRSDKPHPVPHSTTAACQRRSARISRHCRYSGASARFPHQLGGCSDHGTNCSTVTFSRRSSAGSSATTTVGCGSGLFLNIGTTARRRPGETRRAAREGRKRKITDELLREVAEVYRDNLERNPTQAVADRFDKSHRTAALYVQHARDKGFLGAAIKGKAGEQ